MDKATRQLLLEMIEGCRNATTDAMTQNAKEQPKYVAEHLNAIHARLQAMRGLLNAQDWE